MLYTRHLCHACPLQCNLPQRLCTKMSRGVDIIPPHTPLSLAPLSLLSSLTLQTGEGVGTNCQDLADASQHSVQFLGAKCLCIVKCMHASPGVQGPTQVTFHIRNQDATPEGCQVGVVDRWREGHCPGAPGKGVAGPAEQGGPWPCSRQPDTMQALKRHATECRVTGPGYGGSFGALGLQSNLGRYSCRERIKQACQLSPQASMRCTS